MATLNDLVKAVAWVTGLPEATVFAYGRFARQAGLIQQAGRGLNAAAMNLNDAANLLIAVAGTDVTRDAGRAVETFRSLRNGRAYDFRSEFWLPAYTWLQPLGLRHGDLGAGFTRIQSDFGTFFEFLLASTLNGHLAKLFEKVPVAEIPTHRWRAWQDEKSPYLKESLDDLVKKGVIKPSALADYQFGEHIGVEITVSRLVPAVEIEFQRLWDSAQTIGLITFGPERGAQARGAHHLRLTATFTQHTLAAAMLVVANKSKPVPSRLCKLTEGLFWNQFQKLAGLPGTD
jgi:hypothetical protein